MMATKQGLTIGLASAVLLATAAATGAEAQTVLVALDRKVRLVNGVATVVQNPKADAVAVVDLSANPPRVAATIENLPVSVVGPPSSAALTPDGSLALVTANMKVDPADATKQAPDNKLTVIDMTASPPKAIATLEAGLAPAGLAINAAGTLAIVANRNDGSVSVFSIAGKTVTPVSKLTIGPANSGPSGVVITPDGKRALVSRDGDNKITMLNIDGTTVALANRDINAGLRPYGIDIAKDGRMAVVANIGIGTGDADTISVIDLTLTPPRVTDTISVGQTPEGIGMSPDGQFAAAVVMDGSNKAPNSPFYAAKGKVIVFRAAGGKLTKVDEAPIGRWSQGAVFSADNRTILVGNMVEEEAQVLSFDGSKLSDGGVRLKFEGGPASFGWRPHAR
ncbi:MAG: lactonase family protein [Beijerinckiaceae bacterium]